MLENIRRIGLFMIAAQAVIHFAPGRQYEKYIKLISSVIILFMFIRPFTYGQINPEEEWSAGLEQAMEEFEKEDMWQPEGEGIAGRTLDELEKEMKSALNEKISDEIYSVDSVSLLFDTDGTVDVGGGYDSQFQRVEIVMTKKGGEGIEPVLVEDIVIGGETEDAEKTPEAALRYQEIFAGILEVEPDRVEVICVGGW